MTAKEMILHMPKAFVPEAAGDTEATVQYNISEPMYTVIKNGELTVHEGVVENPSLDITMSDENLVKLFNKQLNPMTAFMTGKIKVKGDLMLAQKLAGFMDSSRVENA